MYGLTSELSMDSKMVPYLWQAQAPHKVLTMEMAFLDNLILGAYG